MAGRRRRAINRHSPDEPRSKQTIAPFWLARRNFCTSRIEGGHFPVIHLLLPCCRIIFPCYRRDPLGPQCVCHQSFQALDVQFPEGVGHALDTCSQTTAVRHFSSLEMQRVDRCSMHFQLEVHEPFPDPSVVVHALDLESSALISDAKGDPMGKKPLRDIYDLYPDKLPSVIRDRLKIPFNERSGLDLG